MVRAVAVVACVVLLVVPFVPASVLRPYHALTPLLLVALAIAPVWVRTRRQVTVYVLVVPLVD